MSNNKNSDEIIDALMDDIGESIPVESHVITDTISDILKTYNLSTDLTFVEKIATMKFDNKKGENVDLDSIPKQLTDAAFLPVNTIADIALRQDLDLIISQIPELYSAIKLMTDSICEADVVDGKLARSIIFDKLKPDESETDNIMTKIENVEDRLELDSIIKNHMVFNTLLYGEGYIYAIPYAKVFEDLYKYKVNTRSKKDQSGFNMFDTSSILNGYGYGESAVEISLLDTVKETKSTNQTNKKSNNKDIKNTGIFTESEIIEIDPSYHAKSTNETDKIERTNLDNDIDDIITETATNIHYISEDIALPVIEESAFSLKQVYLTKYEGDDCRVGEVKTFFEQVMEDSMEDKAFDRIKGIYLRILPATKLIPIRVDRNIIGYYYISDMTRPEESGQRRNSGMTGYTLRSPAVGHDTFSPDQMFCQKLASKIINNFDMKFMKDNLSLHQQIVAILQTHKFNEAMMRFVFIPAEHVVRCAINRDGIGKGHSMIEPGVVTARMYMFLKMYSLLYQINNSQIRVYNLKMSGIDKNYKQFVQETMRKFAARRITANDIFNYRSSMTKVSGGSEMIMPCGPNNEPPLTIDKVEAAEAPISTDLLDQLKNETLNATPVPSMMVLNALSEPEFAKEIEQGNTKLNTAVNSCKIEMNPDITRLYRRILRWETDIDPEIIRCLKFTFRRATAKELTITNEMITNFDSVLGLANKIWLSKTEQVGENGEQTAVSQAFAKLLVAELIPQIDIERFDQLVNEARKVSNEKKLNETDGAENLLDNELSGEV